MPFYTYKDKKLFYKENDSIAEGFENHAIIFIHGSGEHSFVWDEQLERLKTDFKLIAIDLPSHGKSDKFEMLSLDVYVKAIKNLIKELELNKVILCGHSLGGAVAQKYYFEYPSDVSGLILCSTGAKLRVLPVILENTLNNFKTFIKNVPVGAFYRNTKEKLKKSYVEEIAKIEPHVVHMDFKICDNFDIMDKIDKIDVPCLIIVGNADKLTPLKYSEYFNKKIQNSTLKVISKAGHSVMIEKPIEVNRVIKNFIENKIKKN